MEGVDRQGIWRLDHLDLVHLVEGREIMRIEYHLSASVHISLSGGQGTDWIVGMKYG